VFFLFWDWVSQTICLAWLGTSIFLLSAAWVARI
jgi:low temperature requirement protein LtrA